MIFDFLKKKRTDDVVTVNPKLEKMDTSKQKQKINDVQLKTNLQVFLDFEKHTEEKYNIVGKIDFSFRSDIPSKESEANFDHFPCIVKVGTQNYGDIEKLDDKQKNHLYNTIEHELIHVRNYYDLTQETRDKISNNLMSIAHWGRLMLDEYSAYKESNALYPETEDELNSSQEKVLESFNHIQKGYLSGATDAQFYVSFYYNCCAIISHSIVDDDFPRDKRNRDYVRACNDFIKDLDEAHGRMPLNYEEYKSLGNKLMSDLLIMAPVNKREFFKFNTRIRLD